MAAGLRRQIIEYLAVDQDWHDVEDIADKFSLSRQDARRTLNDINVDGYISKSDMDYAITQKGLDALTRPAAITFAGAVQRALKIERERKLLATLATRDDWWSAPDIILAGGEGWNRQVVLKSTRDFLKKGFLDYRPSPVFVKSPEYKVTDEGRRALEAQP